VPSSPARQLAVRHNLGQLDAAQDGSVNPAEEIRARRYLDLKVCVVLRDNVSPSLPAIAGEGIAAIDCPHGHLPSTDPCYFSHVTESAAKIDRLVLVQGQA
jgi:hypothetical protein